MTARESSQRIRSLSELPVRHAPRDLGDLELEPVGHPTVELLDDLADLAWLKQSSHRPAIEVAIELDPPAGPTDPAVVGDLDLGTAACANTGSG